MQSNEYHKDSENKSKKNLREANSYKIQFKNRKNKELNENKLNSHNYKSNYNYIYARSNYSAKTFNQKPKSNLDKKNKDSDAQSLNNFSEIDKNAISYINFENSDINATMKAEKNNIKNVSDYRIIKKSKNRNLGRDEIKNLKMDIKELSDSQNKKIEDNNINIKEEKIKNSFENRAIKYNINQKKRLSSENINKVDKLFPKINRKHFNGMKKINKNMKKKISSKIFRKMSKAKELRNMNGINYKDLKTNKAQKINLIEDEKNNCSEEYEIIENDAYNNYIKNNNLNPQIQINNDLQIQEKNIIKNDNNNGFLFNEIDEKLNNLYTKITKKKEKAKKFETINNLEENSNNTNKLVRITYPNLKRYRQKSEPNLKIKNNNLNIKNGINTENDTTKIKYPKVIKENNNLSKFKTLEEKIKNENSTKRMIKTLLNKQNNPELKEILSNLQTTIDKFSKNEERKENNHLSTLPANYFSPFEMFNFESNNYNNKKLIFRYNMNNNNYNYKRKNYNNKKMEKYQSTFNDFKKILNGKNRNKNRNDDKYIYQNHYFHNLVLN